MRTFRFTPPERYQPTKFTAEDAAEWTQWFGQIFSATFGREYRHTDDALLRALMLYASGNDNTLFPLGKGIYIYGKCGTGKSVTMEALRLMTYTCWRQNLWKRFNCTDVALVRSEEGFATIVNYKKPAYFDDLGSEPLMIKLYGSDLYPMLEVITARYNLWQLEGVPTHFTSNYGLPAITEKYGKRIGDRITEMCAALEIKGANQRIS